jgi:tetratricopeptide (TPR) repeat protein
VVAEELARRQALPERMVRVFVSATSKDLGSFREVVRNVLLKEGIHPVTQEDFLPDDRTLVGKLRALMEPVDAVICLVGFSFGGAPSCEGRARRSYTQFEYDLARQSGKPTFVFLATERCPPAVGPVEPIVDRELQLAHRRSMETGEYEWTPFSSEGDLREHVLHLVPKILGLGERSGRQEGDAPLDFFKHPPPEPDFFAGRKFELDQLTRAVERPSPALIAVVGIGGQGKTTLVAHWLKQRTGLPPGMWCTAYRGGFTFDEFLDAALARLTRGMFDKRTLPDEAARALRLLEHMRERPTLFVVDGFERWIRGHGKTPAGTGGDRQELDPALADFLSGATGLKNGTHVILTTRVLPTTVDRLACAVIPVYKEGTRVSLEGLDDDAAVEFLRRMGVRGGDPEILEEAKRYGKHPLALGVLGMLLSARYGGRLDRKSRVSVFDERERLFDLLEETRACLPGGPAAERFLMVAAQCLQPAGPAAIAAGLGPGAPSEASLVEQAVALAKWNVAGWDGGSEVVHLHPLVRDFFSDRTPDAAAIHRRLSDFHSSLPVPEDASTIDHVRPRLLAVEHALRAGDGKRALEVFLGPITPAHDLASWLGAWGHLRRGVDISGRLFDGAEPLVRSELAILRSGWRRRLGEHDAAIAELDSAMALLEAEATAPPLQRLDLMAGALMNRANIHRQVGRLVEAMADYDAAIARLEVLALGSRGHRGLLARARVNRGNLLRDIGRLRSAIEELTSAIDVLQGLVGEGDGARALDLASALANRGNAIADLRRFEDAQRDYDAAKAACRAQSSFQGDVRSFLAHLDLLRGTALCEAGHDRESTEVLDRAVLEISQLVEEGRSDREPELALAHLNRATARLLHGRPVEALQDSTKAVAMFTRLRDEGRLYVRGWLANSLLERAENAHASGAVGWEKDLGEGLALMKDLLARGEKDVRVSFLRRSAVAARYLWGESPIEAGRILREALEVTLSALAEDSPSEGLQAGARHAMDEWDKCFPGHASRGISAVSVSRLRGLLDPK